MAHLQATYPVQSISVYCTERPETKGAREEAESATLGLCYEDEYDDQWTMDRIDRFGKNKFVTRPTVLLEGRSRLDWKLLTHSPTC